MSNKEHEKSGCPGVSLMAERGKWRACVMVDGKRVHLGVYNSKDDAIKARQDYDNFGIVPPRKRAVASMTIKVNTSKSVRKVIQRFKDQLKSYTGCKSVTVTIEY